MNSRRTSRRADGFSLVEVMVAVVIICVGLLGIAKMQALSLSSTSTSRQRALAAMQAASIASAMHSNREYWAGDFQLTGVNPSFSLAGTGTVTSTTDAATATQAQNWLTANNMTFCLGAVGTTAKCDDKQLAAFDLARWWRNGVVPILPGATATIACNSPPVGQSRADLVHGGDRLERARRRAQHPVRTGRSDVRDPDLHAVRGALMDRYTRMRSAPRQGGFTLVELMVTVAIALFLLAGLVTIVQNIRGSYFNQQQLVQLQDEQRFALTVLTDAVQAAGYIPNPTGNTTRQAFPNAGPFAAGWVFAGTHAAGVPDTLSHPLSERPERHRQPHRRGRAVRRDRHFEHAPAGLDPDVQRRSGAGAAVLGQRRAAR